MILVYDNRPLLWTINIQMRSYTTHLAPGHSDKRHITTFTKKKKGFILSKSHGSCYCNESPYYFSCSHSGSLVTCGNVVYVFLFGWWVSLAYFLVGLLMFFTVVGASYGRSGHQWFSLCIWSGSDVVLITSPFFWLSRQTLLEVVPLLPLAFWQGNPSGASWCLDKHICEIFIHNSTCRWKKSYNSMVIRAKHAYCNVKTIFRYVFFHNY